MGTAPDIAERRRILVVDDVELNRVLTEAVLRGATYEVHSVADGATALAALADRRYDLVLMDLDMPGLDGHRAAAAIRRRNSESVKLVALSARNDAVSRLRSRQVGMSAHIGRPIAPHDLLREIALVFDRSPLAERPDPWQRQLYDDWVARLGSDRMQGFLSKLLEQFRALLVKLAARDSLSTDDLHRAAHDVSSTGGMLGFTEVTRCCRTLLEAASADAEQRARPALVDALERAVMCLDRHLSAAGPSAAAA